MLVLRGTYRQVEVIFLIACGFYVTYIISAVLAKPDWLEAAKHVVIPNLHFEFGLFAHLDGAGRHDDRSLAVFLLAGGIRREKSRAEAVSTSARGRSWSAASVAW